MRSRSRSPGRDRQQDGHRGFNRRNRRDRRREEQEDKGPKEWGRPGEEVKLDRHGNERKKLAPGQEKELPYFGLSGALNEDVKTGKVYNGVVMKWSEPADAATPASPGWRLYVFSGDKIEDTLHIYRQSAFLVGKEKKIADIFVEHESCSEQHAVIQFRIKTKQPPPGSLDPPKRYIRPYILDLESHNGTFLNGKRVESGRYFELLDKDVLKFGRDKTKEYVVMYSKEK